MQARPTTDQILDDLAREVRESIIPATTDPALVVNLQMIEQLLTACAVRAANEIAWMADESEALLAYATDVATALDGPALVVQALARAEVDRMDSLYLADCVAAYDRAGEAFSCALEAAMAAEHGELTERGAALVRERVATEEKIRPGFYFPGRS